MENPGKLDLLFDRFLKGESDADELRELFSHFKTQDEGTLRELIRKELDNADTGAYDQQEREIRLHHIYQNIQAQVQRPPSFGFSRIWVLSAAAVTFLLMAGAAIYFFSVNDRPPTQALNDTLQNDALPGGNRATLLLADGRTIDLDNAVNGSLALQDGIEVMKDQDGQITYNIKDNGQESSEISYNTIATPNGGQFKVVLPDGSCVSLNAASSLTYPTRFYKERRVVLSGEGYFQVAADKARPFTVSTEVQDVQVLGTRFNINAYENEPSVRTTLLEGSVKVSRLGKANPKVLRPGEQATLEDKGIQVTEVDTLQAVAWKEDMFYFGGNDIRDVLRQLERWYNVEISYDDKLPQRKFYGQISRGARLSAVLAALEQTSNIKSKVEGRRVMLTTD